FLAMSAATSPSTAGRASQTSAKVGTSSDATKAATGAGSATARADLRDIRTLRVARREAGRGPRRAGVSPHQQGHCTTSRQARQCDTVSHIGPNIAVVARQRCNPPRPPLVENERGRDPFRRYMNLNPRMGAFVNLYMFPPYIR